MLSEKHWKWIGRLADAFSLIALGITVVAALATWLAASHDTREMLTPFGWLLTFFGGTAFLIICLALGLRLISRPAQISPAAAPVEAAMISQDYRRTLEENCLGADGTSVTIALDAVQNSLTITHQGKNYQITISRAGGTSVWVYLDGVARKISIITSAAAKRGDMIDARTTRPLRDAGHLTIGDRVLVEMSDGFIVQALLTGVLYYNAGDDRDEARFKYKVYDPGDFLIPAL